MKMNIEKWTEAIKANPKDLEAYNKLIEIYRSNGEIEELRNIRLPSLSWFASSYRFMHSYVERVDRR